MHKIHKDNCQSQGEKDEIQMAKEQCQSCGKNIRRAQSMRIS